MDSIHEVSKTYNGLCSTDFAQSRWNWEKNWEMKQSQFCLAVHSVLYRKSAGAKGTPAPGFASGASFAPSKKVTAWPVSP